MLQVVLLVLCLQITDTAVHTTVCYIKDLCTLRMYFSKETTQVFSVSEQATTLDYLYLLYEKACIYINFSTKNAVMRIRDSLSRFPDRNLFRYGSRVKKIPRSRIRICIKEFKNFNPKNVSKLLKIWFGIDPSRIPDPEVKKAPDPGSRGQKGTGSRIRNTEKIILYMSLHGGSQCRVQWWDPGAYGPWGGWSGPAPHPSTHGRRWPGAPATKKSSSTNFLAEQFLTFL